MPWRISRRHLAKGAVLALAAMALLTLIHVGILLSRNNLHEVLRNELYRSAQPSAADLSQLKATIGIRTVINLRGANPSADWYREEIAESKRLGVAHIDFRMKASRGLDQRQAAALIDLMRRAEKPILIHCQSGIDRTGLASALYLAAVSRAREEEAERQLSLAYGHLSLPILSGFAMDRTFELMEPSFGYFDS
jgi:protein tyrosine/serine phosphatase